MHSSLYNPMKQFAFSAGLFALAASVPAYSLESQLSCLLEPSQHISLSSQVPGVVKSVSVERGERVNKGQPLIELENGVERASLETAKARADFSARKIERNRNLLEQQLLADYERDEMMTEQQLAQLAVHEAEVRLAQRTILSPVAGLVTKRHVQVGEYVGTDPVLELVTLDPLYAEIVMRAEAYGHIHKGMQLDIDIFGNTMVRKKAKVRIVDQTIDAASGTFGAQLELSNPRSALPSGLKCQLHLDIEQNAKPDAQ